MKILIDEEVLKQALDALAECERELTRLRRIEAAAVKATDHPTWTGDDQYNDMCALVEALKEG